MQYKPGKHVVAEFLVKDSNKLMHSSVFKNLIDELITSLDLCKVGEVYHDFEGGGYTAVVCLTESHLSVHTWPEFGVVTFDVFLSNFMRDNEDKVNMIYEKVALHFGPAEVNKTNLKR